MKKFRFHLLSLVHLPQSKTYLSCAFSQKNRKLAKMLTSLGHEVFFYGSEGSDVEKYCDSDNLHFTTTHTLKDIRNDYGTGDNRFEIGYDWTNTDFKHDFNEDPKNPSTLKFYASCIEHINKVKKDDDFLLCTQGLYQKPIADAVKLFLTCESGIGYRGSVPSMFRSFESPYIQNFSYGSENPYKSMNGSFYDRVIPNYFDPQDIEFSDKKDNYYLFIGRMIKRKGVLTALKACEATGNKLIMVGQGARVELDGSIHDEEPTEWSYPKGNWEYQGFADIAKRKKLMAHAKAVFVPTEYLECFGGTHVEAMLSGTPVITTDFGVFPYTIPNNLNEVVGFRCNTLQDFVDATIKVQSFDKKDYSFIGNYAQRFLMGSVKWEFQKWFEDLYNVYESAVDEGKKIPIENRRKGWSRVVLPLDKGNHKG